MNAASRPEPPHDRRGCGQRNPIREGHGGEPHRHGDERRLAGPHRRADARTRTADLRSAPSLVGLSAGRQWRRGISSTTSSRTLASGHNIVSTVFVECGTMFRAGGPDALRPVGETEFAAGIAAMSASGQLRPDPDCGGHRRHRVPGAGRRGGGRARPPDRGGGRTVPGHPAGRRLGRESARAQPSHRACAGHVPGCTVPRRLQAPRPARAVLRGLVLPPPDPGPDRSRPCLPRHHHRPRPLRRPARRRSVRGPGGRGVRRVAALNPCAGRVPERRSRSWAVSRWRSMGTGGTSGTLRRRARP